MTDNWKTRCDNDHLGHFFYNYMRKIPNEICQLVLDGTLCRVAQCFGRLGLVPGDPVACAGRNHLDAHIPFYAGLMSGQPVAGIDPSLRKNEVKHMLKMVEPKIAFCDYQDLEEYTQAVQELGLDTKIISFGGGEFSFAKLMDTYTDLPPEHEYQVATFNTDKVYCWLCSTSGSTGQPKIVSLTHSHLKKVDICKLDKPKNGVRKTALTLSTLHWLSGSFNALVIPINHIKVQTSAPVTTEHAIDIINKYKPASILCAPTFIAPILHHKKHCDLTCLDILKLAGSKVHFELLRGLRARVREDTIIQHIYGQSETADAVLQTFSEIPYGNVGTLNPKYEAKLVSPETGKEILEPNVTGELLVKGPIMAGYYNDPKTTAETSTEDGYFKTGDLFYKDENGYYFFVERLKMLLKYRNYQVVPPEVEEVILTHPSVVDVCVTGVPHPDDGEHIVACVVRQRGSHVTAQEIKDLVAKHLSDSKRLRGGVVFLDTLPQLSTGKVARLEVKKLVLTAHRE